MWRVELLGKVQIVRGDDGGVIARFESRKVAALLARLALFPTRVHPREELAALLWPDADRQGGLARLRHVLSSLGRQTVDGEARLGPLFIADRFSVRLGEAVECDAVLFERAVRQKRVDEARTLYTGDLLPGFYDEWIVTEQERLRALFDGLSVPVPAVHASRAVLSSPAPKATVGETDMVSPVVVPATTPSARGFLPHYLTTFWGRETEKQTLRDLLTVRRLITVVGPVGCGKTRFVVEFARDLLENRDAPFDQVVFVPLGECAVPEQIVPRLRAVLQLPPEGDAPIEQIALALDPLRVLFVLDDAEHLAEGQGGAAGEIIAALLARLPRARCIVSSRRLLHVSGEQAFALEPLPLPAPNPSEDDINALRQNPCIALLCDRAKSVRPDFAITPRNMEAATRLCRELEGVPLAIELAAGRIRAFSLQQMCEQIEGDTGKTAGSAAARGGRWALTTPPAFVRANKTARRHHSLHEAVGASWQLLGKRQQEFLAALSVLRGQWTLPFAAHVSSETEETAHALLEELTDHSLLQLYLAPDAAPDQKTHWALLQTVGDFAHSQLPKEIQSDLRRRLSRYVLRELFDGGAADELFPFDLFVWEAALNYAIADGEANEALALCVAFNEVWLRIGSPQSALQTIKAALKLSGGSAHLRASACEVGSFFAAYVLDFALCDELAEAAWESARHVSGDAAPVALASAYLARARAAYVRHGDIQAVVGLLHDAESHARQIAPVAATQAARESEETIGRQNRAHLLTSILNLRGAAWLRANDFIAAEADLHAAQKLLENQSRPSQVRINQVRFNRVSVVYQQGDISQALALLDECAETAAQTGDLKLEAQVFQNRGAILSEQGRFAESARVLREAVQKFHDIGTKYGLCYALWNLSRPLVQTGETQKGVFLLAFARNFWQAQSGEFSASEEAFCQSVVAKASETSSPEQIAKWQTDGQSATLGAAVAFALDNQ